MCSYKKLELDLVKNVYFTSEKQIMIMNLFEEFKYIMTTYSNAVATTKACKNVAEIVDLVNVYNL